jgi:DNA invertase Pin-like site-specific DNA recombinase
MMNDAHQKVTPRHLRRAAYLYVRQSTLRQVLENTESTARQYALRQRAVALGWSQGQVVVIDSDQGQSGASATGRDGFQRLVADVGLGRAGIVMGLEVSRLARNSTDWHRLLEICALTDTLILDEDGLYDPAHFNDRLLLGLKGTMSEAELHVLRARLRGGVLNKARRGELETPLPIGFVYGPDGRVRLDPDQQVQGTVRLFFETFRRTGSGMATVKAFRHQRLKFPRRVRSGPQRGEVLWDDLQHARALEVLHNPRYAGAFCFGRTRQRKSPGHGVRFETLGRDEWIALVPDAHAGYIAWDVYEENQRRLRENSQAHGAERRKSPPREGPALLQGLVLCGVCGERMTVRYRQGQGHLWPEYVCQKNLVRHGAPLCQLLAGGASIDEAVGRLLVETVTPMALEVALSVQQELEVRWEDTDRLRRQQVERARYEAELARRRYMQVDPDHRLVADELEGEWNRRLRILTDAQEEYERQRQADRTALDEEQRRRIVALATDFPQLWQAPGTPHRERKRMVRLLLEDVTLIKGTSITVHVRFRGGATRTLTLAPPLPAWALRKTSPEVVAEVDRLLDDYTEAQIAQRLTERGFRSGTGKPIDPMMVSRVRQRYRLTPRYQRLRDRGLLTMAEVAQIFGICLATAKVWRRAGLLRAHAYDDKPQYLFEPPGADAPTRYTWKGLSAWTRRRRSAPQPTSEVQYAT